jgi:hypothetical protein
MSVALTSEKYLAAIAIILLAALLWGAWRWGRTLWNRYIGRHTPPHVEDSDRAAWPTGELLWETELQNPQAPWLGYPPYHDSSELTFDQGVMKFHVKPETDDEWAYVYLDPAKYNWRDFSWQTRFRRRTHFQEYAFNFRYVDFDNRYRYRFEDDYLFFDTKVRGKWYILTRQPFPMALDAWYDLRIDVRGNRMRCYVNNTLMVENVDDDIASGSICIILWEIDKITPAIAEIGPQKVYRIP